MAYGDRGGDRRPMLYASLMGPCVVVVPVWMYGAWGMTGEDPSFSLGYRLGACVVMLSGALMVCMGGALVGLAALSCLGAPLRGWIGDRLVAWRWVVAMVMCGGVLGGAMAGVSELWVRGVWPAMAHSYFLSLGATCGAATAGCYAWLERRVLIRAQAVAPLA
ncbi:hypothetical protein GTZ99_02870 [Novosphingobium sp. FSY-8]|uniref:Uncharacterized protein n=1 Tax=Novosphingobium ovatum TaxID=1908523 RepID=A0ABW9XAD5_9SPHN|nr:hypothetical protein [Novosphingobium ovatum]NBC35494.1 hypothetical protein [Novosphingobium ovatum]